jgi:DNA repair exonuclease SbcCD ATPase subunit
MELTKLSLTNFRSHRKLELDFTSGITGIVGDNGKGKSSIVEAIIFLFTGEGYGAKSDMISVGESTGYVVGQLRIEGKEAVLERHLDTSKVAFKYEGVTYKKSGEVAEIWDKLFQIDKNIFKNIVVARQGDIALLFSGDNSVKEKIFQKIFLVPNTTKTRDIIWNKYIKGAPPEYPVPDMPLLETSLAEVRERLEASSNELLSYPKDLAESLAVKLSREKYLAGCKAASGDRSELERRIAESETSIATYQTRIQALEAKLASVSINEIMGAYEAQKAAEPIWRRRVTLDAQLKEKEAALVPVGSDEIAELSRIEETLPKEEAEKNIFLGELAEVNKTLSDYRSRGLIGASSCPTCGTELADSKAYIEHLESKVPKLDEEISSRAGRISLMASRKAEISAKVDSSNQIQRDIEQLRNTLAGIGTAEYDQGSADMYQAVIKQYRELEAELGEVKRSKGAEEPKVMELKLKMLSLPIYDNAKGTLETEIDEVAGEILGIREKIQARSATETEVIQNRSKLESLEGEKLRGETNIEKNRSRNHYVDILNELYEMLHTSQFPRKLIQTYSSTVSEYLAENLRHFNFPYRAEVNDNFGIDVFDAHERKLPSVSGGQEIMIGVALRLALHSMFGSAFPMMIFDEGSVHLSQESKRSYFEIIRSMKNMNNFKQVIIIDHDEDLAGVVDNTIKL